MLSSPGTALNEIDDIIRETVHDPVGPDRSFLNEPENALGVWYSAGEAGRQAERERAPKVLQFPKQQPEAVSAGRF